MPFYVAHEDYWQIVQVLKLLKLCHAKGIYADVVRGSRQVCEDNIYELIELSLEHIAPIFDRVEYFYDYDKDAWCNAEDIEEFDDTKIDMENPHTVYCFSSPAMREFYRICRILEYRDGLSPSDNHPVQEAHERFHRLFDPQSSFWAYFDDDDHTTEMRIETSEQYGYNPFDVLEGIWSQLRYYESALPKLRIKLLMGPAVSLPLLPAPAGGVTGHG